MGIGRVLLAFLTPLTTVNVVQAFSQTSPIQLISRWRGLWKGYAILRKCDFIVIVIIIILDLGFLFLFFSIPVCDTTLTLQVLARAS